MDRIVERSLLFDFYGELLTDHQKSVYGEYVQEDMSISEIAQIHGISRQGAHDMIKRCEKLLLGYETRLHLVDHYLKIREMVREAGRYAEEISGLDDLEMIRDRVAHITRLTTDILEQY
jgi:hypothetical protein